MVETEMPSYEPPTTRFEEVKEVVKEEVKEEAKEEVTEKVKELIKVTVDTGLYLKLKRLRDPPDGYSVAESNYMVGTPIDCWAKPGCFIFNVDMPGMKHEDIDVHLEDHEKYGSLLFMGGERKRDEGVDYLNKERWFGGFKRSSTLPENADKDNIDWVYRNGVLTVTVQILQSQPKSIEDQVASLTV